MCTSMERSKTSKFRSATSFKKLLTRSDAARRLGQRHQEIEFDGRQGQVFAAQDGAARLRVKAQIAHHNFRLAGFPLRPRDLGTANRRASSQ